MKLGTHGTNRLCPRCGRELTYQNFGCGYTVLCRCCAVSGSLSWSLKWAVWTFKAKVVPGFQYPPFAKSDSMPMVTTGLGPMPRESVIPPEHPSVQKLVEEDPNVLLPKGASFNACQVSAAAGTLPDGREVLNSNTLQCRLLAGHYRHTKNERGQCVISREVAKQIIRDAITIAKMRSLPDLARACGLHGSALNLRAVNGEIKASRIVEHWYVDVEEWKRVTTYFSKMQTTDACRLLGVSKVTIGHRVRDGLSCYQLKPGGERRYDPDELLYFEQHRTMEGFKKRSESFGAPVLFGNT